MIVQLRTLTATIAVAVLVASTGLAVAGPLFTQPSNVQSSSGRRSDFDFSTAGFATADNFELAIGATVTSLEWFGGYGFDSSQPTPFDDFTIRFYSDQSGSPAENPFAEYHVGNAVNRVDTGQVTFHGFDLFMYSTLIPDTNLDGETKYYLSIVANTSGFSTDWFWGSGIGDKEGWGRDLRPTETWIRNGSDSAFTLNGTNAVPEPSSLVLVTLGCCTFLGSGLRRRRRQFTLSHGRDQASL